MVQYQVTRDIWWVASIDNVSGAILIDNPDGSFRSLKSEDSHFYHDRYIGSQDEIVFGLFPPGIKARPTA
jgi:hypothetical protein